MMLSIAHTSDGIVSSPKAKPEPVVNFWHARVVVDVNLEEMIGKYAVFHIFDG